MTAESTIQLALALPFIAAVLTGLSGLWGTTPA